MSITLERPMAQWVTKLCVDDNHRCGKVQACRDLIYGTNYCIDGSAVEKLLQETSLIPNTVRYIGFYLIHKSNRSETLEHVFRQALSSWLQHVFNDGA